MAILQVLAVLDAAVNSYNRPFCVPTRGLGVRAFMDEAMNKKPDNPMAQHPKDFSLWLLGTWDEESGVFLNQSPPERIAQASDFCHSEE